MPYTSIKTRFALAYAESILSIGGKGFYFIDTNGDRVEQLSTWDKAEQFDSRGLAKVDC